MFRLAGRDEDDALAVPPSDPAAARDAGSAASMSAEISVKVQNLFFRIEKPPVIDVSLSADKWIWVHGLSTF